MQQHKPTRVVNLETEEELWYHLPPEEAVVAAYRQRTLGDPNWWEPNPKVPPLVYGDHSVACGPWCAILTKKRD